MRHERGMVLCAECPARRPLVSTSDYINEEPLDLFCPTNREGEALCEVYGVVFHWPDDTAACPDEVQSISGVIYGYCWFLNNGEGGFFVQSHDQPIAPLSCS
jgi:hypothetical protein